MDDERNFKEPSSDFQAGFNCANSQPLDTTKSKEWQRGWYANPLKIKIVAHGLLGGDMGRAAALEKMETELAELKKRIFRMDCFIAESPTFNTLSSIQQNLLTAQTAAMESYRDILAIRIEMFDT